MNFNWDFVKKILIRALHTAAQTALGMFTIGATIKEIDWLNILKSLAVGIPESGVVEGTMTIDNSNPEDPKFDMDLGENFDIDDIVKKKVFKMNIVEGTVSFDDEEENQNGSEN